MIKLFPRLLDIPLVEQWFLGVGKKKKTWRC